MGVAVYAAIDAAAAREGARRSADDARTSATAAGEHARRAEAVVARATTTRAATN